MKIKELQEAKYQSTQDVVYVVKEHSDMYMIGVVGPFHTYSDAEAFFNALINRNSELAEELSIEQLRSPDEFGLRN